MTSIKKTDEAGLTARAIQTEYLSQDLINRELTRLTSVIKWTQ